ncbi:MAG: DUF4105 domain-containing protein [Bacteroidales bacterium]|nr:DUF4105 domain-containing protein [Bacteroidales bacterium]
MIYSLIFLYSFLNFSLKAQNGDSLLQVSLLTASPGEMAYERFGHTALRVKDKSKDLDVVFNYGVFSFNTPNFYYRFVKGETDYILAAVNFPYFLTEYALRGSRVTEQILNLTPEEKTKLFEALKLNAQKENRVYRYSFLFDNCSTRPRDIIENNINGKVNYLNPGPEVTFRDLVHSKSDVDPWLTFGIDLVFGKNADKTISYRQEMFLPEILMQAFETAKIDDKPLINQTNILVMEDSDKEISPLNPLLSPLFVCWSLFVLILILSIIDVSKNIQFKLSDTILFGIAGIAGIILFYLNFISVHPAVDNNYNCVWLQPLQLFAAIAIWVKSSKRILYYYHFVNFVALSVLLLCYWFLQQVFNAAFFPLIGVLMLRSLTYIIIYKREKRF